MERQSFLLGLIGSGIQKSRTPAMHELEGDAHGLRVLYQTIDLETLKLGVDALPDLLSAAERMGFAGLNITYPCKQAILPLLNELSPEAARIGAVNTVVLKDGRRTGHNTDCTGFALNFRMGLPGARRARVLQLGAGGAGAAVANALLQEGVERLAIFDADKQRSAVLATALCSAFGAGRAVASEDAAADVAACDGLVNCTPIGAIGHPGAPIDVDLLTPAHWVADIVYFPIETELLAAARARGCRTLDGGGMAVFQAAAAFKLFTGREPDVARMRRRFEEIGDRTRQPA
ncbi:MAG: shikimate dehydrogenase [Hyphomicrobiales bacterium]|nr:shikimate dehydrogenase [Hyphomicrobiales bacterium]